MFTLNPFKQLDKAKDAQRHENLKQVNSALDAYNNDTGCYPAAVGFNSPWQRNSAYYMQKVPQDPDCAGGGSCYAYYPDPSSCPKWNILFAKVNAKASSSIECPLEQMSGCLPPNYNSLGYNYCIISGKVDCSYVSANAISPSTSASGTSPAGGGGGGGPTPVPSPTLPPGGCYCSTAVYDIRSGLCNNVGSGGVYCDPGCSISCTP